MFLGSLITYAILLTLWVARERIKHIMPVSRAEVLQQISDAVPVIVQDVVTKITVIIKAEVASAVAVATATAGDLTDVSSAVQGLKSSVGDGVVAALKAPAAP